MYEGFRRFDLPGRRFRASSIHGVVAARAAPGLRNAIP